MSMLKDKYVIPLTDLVFKNSVRVIFESVNLAGLADHKIKDQ